MVARVALSIPLLLTLTVSATAAPRRVADHPVATVLCYHIVEAPAAPRMHIDRETFRQHMRYIEMTGYNVIPLKHVWEYATGKRASIPENAVVLTFDDGWRSTYTEVFPELQRRGFPFTVFVYPEIIGKTANALTWAQIREMSEAGVDIQSHGLTHAYLGQRKNRWRGDARYAEWLRRELSESRRILENQTGKRVGFLAYPYGDYDDGVIKAAAGAGYSAALTCDFGAVRKGSDPLRMKRVVIDDRMDFAAFRRYLGTAPMQLAEMTPRPGVAGTGGVTTVSAKIAEPEALDPGSVGMALLSLGSVVPYSYDARTGSVTLVLRQGVPAEKKVHRALVWGRDRRSGKRVEASWVFRLDEEKPTLPVPSETVAASMVGGSGAGGGRR